MVIKAVNPATGETIKDYEEMTPDEVQGIVEKSHQAFLNWRWASFAERARPMRKANEILQSKAPDYARLMAQEMGKPVKSGRAEVEKLIHEELTHIGFITRELQKIKAGA